jgi:hypothetical protein
MSSRCAIRPKTRSRGRFSDGHGGAQRHCGDDPAADDRVPRTRAKRNPTCGANITVSAEMTMEMGLTALITAPVHLPRGQIAMVSWCGPLEPEAANNVARKLGASNRTHAVATAVQLGLLGPIGA